MSTGEKTPFLDLPREIYDDIVDVCFFTGGTPLLYKCALVHTALLPRVYTYLFANVSFYSSAAKPRNERIDIFLDILKRRPYVAQMVQSVSFYLHEDNDWLLEEKGFLEIVRLLKDLGACPSRLNLYRLPGIEYIRIPDQQFESQVIRPLFSSSVKHLTIRNCMDIPYSFLSAFTVLEEVVLDRVSLPAPTCDNYQSFRCRELPRIRRLEIRRCLPENGISCLLNPWCGLPFDFSALQELQCPIDDPSNVLFIGIALTPLGALGLQELRLIINLDSDAGRSTLGHLTQAFSDAPSKIFHLRLTLLLRRSTLPGLNDYRIYVEILTSLVCSKILGGINRLTIDFPEGWIYGCCFQGTSLGWENFRNQTALWKKRGKPTGLDVRLNFFATTPPRRVHVDSVDVQTNLTASADAEPDFPPVLERFFPDWYTFDYDTSSKPSPFFFYHNVPYRHVVLYSAHSIWPHPLLPSELIMETLE